MANSECRINLSRWPNGWEAEGTVPGMYYQLFNDKSKLSKLSKPKLQVFCLFLFFKIKIIITFQCFPCAL